MTAPNHATRTARPEVVPGALAALLLIWAGVLIGVSFLAAPVKFNAPSLSLPVALDVGRQEFFALNLVEIGLAVATLALGFLARPSRAVWLALGLAVAIVALQGLWLLQVLDARTEMIIRGQSPPPAPWHTVYIVLEVAKLLALLAAGALALLRPRPAT